MTTVFKISGAAVLATGILLAQAPDPARSTMPGATTSSTQDKNNAAPGSMMNRSTPSPRQSMGEMPAGETITGYLVNTSCNDWARAGLNKQSMPARTTTSATSPSDPTTAPMTQPDPASRRRTNDVRTDTRASATEMANSENMIEDRVNANGRRVPDMPATTQLAWNKPPTACSAGLSTTQFGIFSNGKLYAFDPASNSNFQQQYQNNEKMKSALSNGMSTPVLVTATASVLSGDTIHVNKIRRGQ